MFLLSQRTLYRLRVRAQSVIQRGPQGPLQPGGPSMDDARKIKRMNADAITQAYEDAREDGNHGKAERIRAANPDLFAGLDSSEMNDMLHPFAAIMKYKYGE